MINLWLKFGLFSIIADGWLPLRSSEGLGHLRSFWIQMEACVIPSYHRMLIDVNPVAETDATLAMLTG